MLASLGGCFHGEDSKRTKNSSRDRCFSCTHHASCRYLKLEIFSEIRSSIAYEYEREDQEEIECAIEREAKPA